MPMAQKTPTSLPLSCPRSPGSSQRTKHRFGHSPSCPVTAPPQPWGHSPGKATQGGSCCSTRHGVPQMPLGSRGIVTDALG